MAKVKRSTTKANKSTKKEEVRFSAKEVSAQAASAQAKKQVEKTVAAKKVSKAVTPEEEAQRITAHLLKHMTLKEQNETIKHISFLIRNDRAEKAKELQKNSEELLESIKQLEDQLLEVNTGTIPNANPEADVEISPAPVNKKK